MNMTTKITMTTTTTLTILMITMTLSTMTTMKSMTTITTLPTTTTTKSMNMKMTNIAFNAEFAQFTAVLFNFKCFLQQHFKLMESMSKCQKHFGSF